MQHARVYIAGDKQMKRTCYRCKALSIWTYSCKCWLDFKQEGPYVDPKPAEECPKPRTYAELAKAKAMK